MKHPFETYASEIAQTFQLLLDISDEIEWELDGNLDKISRFQWIAMAEQRLAEERNLC